MPPPDGIGAPADALHRLIRRQVRELAHRDDPDVSRLVAGIHRRHPGHVAAVLLYGSYLRGKRDTLLDFYVLLTDLAGSMPPLQALGNRALPPNVYYLALGDGEGTTVRAKYATLTVGQFQRVMGDFHSYFWSRFTQPVGLVEVLDTDVENRVVDALAVAAGRFAAEVAPVMEDGEFTAAQLWRRGLALTYRCELRSEGPDGVDDLYAHYARHFEDILRACAVTPGAAVTAGAGADRYRARPMDGAPAGRVRWAARQMQGKILSVLRLVKAAGTFDDPLDYLLWKIQRHSGIYIAPTERQRRHPLIFAWPLLWRLHRRGAFR